MSPGDSSGDYADRRHEAIRIPRGVGQRLLEVPPGTAAVVLGPSGCGKTTMLRIIAGLEVPDSGQVALDGATVSAAGRVDVPPHRRKLGFVFQDLALWPHLTVRQNLDFMLGSMALPRTEQDRRAQERARACSH